MINFKAGSLGSFMIVESHLHETIVKKKKQQYLLNPKNKSDVTAKLLTARSTIKF